MQTPTWLSEGLLPGASLTIYNGDREYHVQGGNRESLLGGIVFVSNALSKMDSKDPGWARMTNTLNGLVIAYENLPRKDHLVQERVIW